MSNCPKKRTLVPSLSVELRAARDPVSAFRYLGSEAARPLSARTRHGRFAPKSVVATGQALARMRTVNCKTAGPSEHASRLAASRPGESLRCRVRARLLDHAWV